MKKKKNSAVTIILFLLIGMGTQAQFFKKIAKSAEKAAERTVLKKTEEKASEKTDQALDDILNMDFGAMGRSNVDPSSLPKSYEFDWRYTLEMSHEKGDMKFHYFLSEGGGAFGSRPEMTQGANAMSNMLMIIDPTLSLTTILMNNGGRKTGTVMSNPDVVREAAQDSSLSDYEFKEIGTKQILGFTCQGFQMENEDTRMIMYVAFDTPVSFNSLYSGSNSKQMPKGFDSRWLDKIGDNSLMMEMDFHNKKKQKQRVKMSCVALEKEPLLIDVSQYEFLQMQMQK